MYIHTESNTINSDLFEMVIALHLLLTDRIIGTKHEIQMRKERQTDNQKNDLPKQKIEIFVR